ncbi:MAG: NahK/ErcS family hybrid sensor histidine kinase/response regulator [Pseudomonadota bacterium]
MIDWWTLLLLSVLYVGILFAVARWGDKVGAKRLPAKLRVVIYSLALGVYCTSWTFYGAVGSAATNGWLYLPIYLGPMLVFVFGWGVITRMVAISKRQNLTSIADFIAARYGKARSLAVLVTVIATVGSVPYIALQLKAIVAGFDIVSNYGTSGNSGIDTALIGASALALFAILFGTRKIDVTEHHDGMMLAIAFESLIKLLAFIAVGLFALFLLGSGQDTAPDVSMQVDNTFSVASLPDTFVTQLVLAGAAILCLPRQFHVMVVEARRDANIGSARWMFPLYLALFSVFVIPITLAGLRTLSTGSFSADSFVLALPLTAGYDWLTLLAFLGGFSAATGMAIVACVALSTMISNEIIMPLLLKLRAERNGEEDDQQRDYSRLLLNIRRVSIGGIAAMAYVYYAITDESAALASIGLLSFAAAAQFAPLMLFGMYWPRATWHGALTGLGLGFVLWAYTLFLPTLARAGAFSKDFLDNGLFGFSWLRPEALLFDLNAHALTHGVAWSLGTNVLALIVVSLLSRQSLVEKIQARVFSTPPTPAGRALIADADTEIQTSDLMALAERFLGEQHARLSFADFAAAEKLPLNPAATADRQLVQFTERLLAGAIGAASARVVMTTALRRTGMDIGDVVTLLDETSHAIRFNRQLLEATLENITQGVSVVDSSQQIIGWNQRYEELMGYPAGMVHVGQPIAELIRYNAERGRFGDRNAEREVAKRLAHLKSGTPYVYQSAFDDGKVVEIRGQPMPDGGYVTTFTDITEFKAQEAALVDAKLSLERRVADRTAELEDAMTLLHEAKKEAEDANASKTKFLAAAAHDLLQPLNATKLFAALLHEDRKQLAPEQSRLVERLQTGLGSVEDLLSALLDISRLDTAAPEPEPKAVAVSELFAALKLQFAEAFEEDGLELRIVDTRYWVRSDPALLRRILQNFLSNARRYTDSGGVLLGCRRRGHNRLALQVVDTGAGIAPADRERIFEEFQRLAGSDKSARRGLGLGLAIVRRIARLLEHPVSMRSEPGRGSCFEVLVPLTAAEQNTLAVPQTTQQAPSSLVGEHILCIDNEAEILVAMAGLLTKWGALPLTATDQREALAACHKLRQDRQRRPSLLLVDYHLDNGVIGLDVIDAVRKLVGRPVPALILTADHTDEVNDEIRQRGFALLRKPVKPAALRAQITSLLGRREVA